MSFKQIGKIFGSNGGISNHFFDFQYHFVKWKTFFSTFRTYFVKELISILKFKFQ